MAILIRLLEAVVAPQIWLLNLLYSLQER